MGTTFLLVVIGWIMFRAESIRVAVHYIERMFNMSLMSVPNYVTGMKKTFFCLLILISVEWIQRNKKHGLDIHMIKTPIVKYGIYFALVCLIIWFGGKSETFIYFQF